MMDFKELYFIRPGHTNQDERRVFHNSADASLSSAGITSAEEVGDMLHGQGIQSIISGDYLRQAQTSEILAKYLNLKIVYSHLLQERRGGHLEGKVISSAKMDRSAYVSYYSENHRNMEPLEKVLARVEKMALKILSAPQYKIAIVGTSWINSYMLNLFCKEQKLCYHPQDTDSIHYLCVNKIARCVIKNLNQDNLKENLSLGSDTMPEYALH